MNITIAQTDWRADRLKQAASVFGHRLMSKERCAQLNIQIKLVAGTRNFGKAVTRGHMWPVNWKRGKELPTDFVIELRKTDPWTWTVECLAHEMVHVMQYASGKLQRKRGMLEGNDITSLRSWMGGPWIEHDVMEHDDRPWEIEAESKVEELRNLFFTIERVNWVH